MRQQLKQLPQLNHRPSIDEEDSYPGRLHTIQRKLKFGSNTYIKSSNAITDNRRPKQNQVTESQILKQIDSKLEMHKKDIEQRNDMIMTIERGFETIKFELAKEKIQNEEKGRRIVEMQASYQAIQLRLKQASENVKINLQAERDKERLIQLETTIQGCQKKENELIRTIESIKQQINQCQECLKQKDNINEDQKKLKDQLHQIEDSNNRLEHQINDVQKIQDKEINEKQLLKKQYDNLRNDITQKENNINSQISSTLAQVKQLEQEKQQLLENQKKMKESNESQGKLNEQISLIKNQINDHKKNKDNEIKKIKQSIEVQQKSLNELIHQLEELKKKQLDLQKNLQDSDLQYEQLKLQKQQQEQLIENNHNKIESLLEQIENIKQTLNKQQNTKKITETIGQLERTDKDIQKNLSCTFCNKFIKQPVTIIPCGHSYCFDCKKGYSKECFKCGPKLKIEAMYRNELLDDIIAMVKLIQQSVASMKTITKS